MIVWSFDSQLQLNCQQVYCSHETSFHFWMNRWKDIIRLRYRSMKSVKIKINETSLSSISTDWSIQSISIKSVFPIFIDSSIDKSIPIFIHWLLWDVYMCHAIHYIIHVLWFIHVLWCKRLGKVSNFTGAMLYFYPENEFSCFDSSRV